MKLRTHRKISKQIITTEGSLEYYRYVLRPDGDESAAKLHELENAKAVIPLDSYLGIADLPFKITVSMMLEISYWAAKTGSYQDAEDFFKRTKHLSLSDDTIRKVVNYIGRLIFEEDCRHAKAYETELNTHVRETPNRKEGTLYLQADGAALNTRTKDQNDSTWRENKLGLAFSSDHIHYWKNAKGQTQHRICGWTGNLTIKWTEKCKCPDSQYTLFLTDNCKPHR